MVNTPYWLDHLSANTYPSLKEDIEVEVAIVGGGITGLTSAYILSQWGMNVALFDANQLMHSTTGHTTAKITSQHGLLYNTLLNKYGLEKAKLYAQSNEKAIDFIEQQVKTHRINCDFKRLPAFVYTQENQYVKDIENEVAAAKKVGIPAYLETELSLPFPIKAAVRFDNQAQFHPIKYLLGLLKQIETTNCQLYENTKIVELQKNTPHLLISEQGYAIRAKHIIIASHYPFYDGLGFYFSRLIPKKSYIVAIKAKSKLADGMYINVEQPTRSLRNQSTEDGDLILIAGENHNTGQGENLHQHYEALEAFGKEYFDVEKVPYKWSTEDYSTVDDLPMIGQLSSNSKNIYVGTGYAKWGMTKSTLAAIIISDIIMKKDNPWIGLYAPSRQTLNESAKQLINHNLKVGYEFIKGKLFRGDKEIDLDIEEAATVSISGKKCGVYRDKDNQFYMLDLTCTHMGCEVTWNSADLTWDCPCHGSRFTYKGDIVQGPAHHPLKRYEEGHNTIDPNI
jgi:glycine/D-amino acid oxidase-like deaminating enzyme/nitrite reductase/ring-hydroxylating ferredoxin subunit